MSSDMIQIRNGNALNLFRKLEDKSIDLIIADPPYNLGKDYGNSNDKLEFKEYLEFSRNWITQAHRVLRDTGTIYVFMGVRFISYLYAIMEQGVTLGNGNYCTLS